MYIKQHLQNISDFNYKKCQVKYYFYNIYKKNKMNTTRKI